MRPRKPLLVAAGTLPLLICCSVARAQIPQTPTTAGTSATETIDVTGRPIPQALDVIEDRYGVAIDYSDPVYTSTVDTQLIHYLSGKPLNKPILIPRIWSLKLKYTEVNGHPETCPPPPQGRRLPCYIAQQRRQPEGGITALIRKLLAHFAAQGGSDFAVRKLDGLTGPQWEVYPVKARNALATFVPQTDFLGATVHIPFAKRTAGIMLELIAQQLTKKWGHKFEIGMEPTYPMMTKAKYGAENITARHALLEVLGGFEPPLVWRMYYGPDDHSYTINVAMLPYSREPLRPPTPKAAPARVVPSRPWSVGFWMNARNGPWAISKIQGALVKARFLHTGPTGKWDANAVGALRRFQIAHGLRPTGEFDSKTAAALLPLLPLAPAYVVPAKPAMDHALAFWLGDTRSGRKEIQEALTEAGFYKGPINGKQGDAKTRQATMAFQKANGLKPTGILNYKGMVKLAPYLPKPDK